MDGVEGQFGKTATVLAAVVALFAVGGLVWWQEFRHDDHEDSSTDKNVLKSKVERRLIEWKASALKKDVAPREEDDRIKVKVRPQWSLLALVDGSSNELDATEPFALERRSHPFTVTWQAGLSNDNRQVFDLDAEHYPSSFDPARIINLQIRHRANGELVSSSSEGVRPEAGQDLLSLGIMWPSLPHGWKMGTISSPTEVLMSGPAQDTAVKLGIEVTATDESIGGYCIVSRSEGRRVELAHYARYAMTGDDWAGTLEVAILGRFRYAKRFAALEGEATFHERFVLTGDRNTEARSERRLRLVQTVSDN